MKYSIFLFFAVLMAVVIGCGGSSSSLTTGSTTGFGTVSGVVFDQSGGVVANASVYTTMGGSKFSTTNVTGAYSLSNVAGADIAIQAEAFRGTTRYYGTNLASVFSGEQSKNVNIALFPSNSLGHIVGTVRDSAGSFLKGVRVFARQNTAGTVLSSSVGISDATGSYFIDGIGAGIDYAVQANAKSYGSDSTIVNVRNGETKIVNIVLPVGATVTPDAPTNFMAQAWTSPKNATRSANGSGVITALKNALGVKQHRVSKVSRVSAGTNAIEVDLFWDPVIASSTLGYGIYRAPGVVGAGSLVNVDFSRDPLGEFFADQDPNLVADTTYSYGVTTVSTSFDVGAGGESSMSSVVTVDPLQALLINSAVVTVPDVHFSWTAVTGVTGYKVVVFPEYPTVLTTSVYVSPSVSGTSFDYTGAELVRGTRYYFAIVGTSSTGDKTASVVASFAR